MNLRPFISYTSNSWIIILSLLLILFELASVYFIMPMPGSQEVNSLDFAYLLYSLRWFMRGLFIIGSLIILLSSWRRNLWIISISVILVIAVEYLVNMEMNADHIFLQPKNLVFEKVKDNQVNDTRMIMGIEVNGETKAYPIQYLGYHHQVIDKVGGKDVMITYCTVCRTGRVYEPLVDGQVESFRLVGMDHYNAMFEDSKTKSWWRQENGEAVVGPCRGKFLPEIDMQQMELKKWIKLYPQTKIMQADSIFKTKYDSMSNYEAGKYYGKLTKRDTISGNPKSWVIKLKGESERRIIDWNQLVKERIKRGQIDQRDYFVVLCEDLKSFAAFYITRSSLEIKLINDTIYLDNAMYKLNGIALSDINGNLERIPAYQEYLHSANTFIK